jgi:hemerythrin-like domain-containing protein
MDILPRGALCYVGTMDRATEILERLRREHDNIRVLAGRFAALLSEEILQDVDPVAACRWEMTKAILQHVAFEDRYAFLPLERDPRPAVAAVTQRFKRELEEIQASFERHMDRWSSVATHQNWTAYRTVALAQNDLLLDRIKREENELYPFIASNVEIASGAPLPPPERNWARAAWNVQDSLDRR